MATDINLPVETSLVSPPKEFHMITLRGSHDLYRLDGHSFEVLTQRHPQQFTKITNESQIQELEESIRRQRVMRADSSGTLRVVGERMSEFSANYQKVIDVFTIIGSTFLGHTTCTCGHYCLLTNLALLSESILSESDKIEITFNEASGLTKLTLDKFKSSNHADIDITEEANREKIKVWLIENQAKFFSLEIQPEFEAFLIDLEKKRPLECHRIVNVIRTVTELTNKETSVLDPTIHDTPLTHEQQEQAINAARSVTPENATEKLEQAKEQLKGVIELDGITTNDIAIIALLTAFLAVIGGPATPALFTALLLPLVATLKFHHIPFTEDDLTKVKQLSTLPTPTGTVQAPRCQPLQTTPDRLEQPIAVC